MREAWTVYNRFKMGLGKKEGAEFLRGVDTPKHTIISSVFRKLLANYSLLQISYY